MIASLPMYDRPETAGANDRFWALIRDGLRGAGVAAPDGLTRTLDPFAAHWTDPALVLSQTCGYPYRAGLHGKVTLIGTPDYGVEDCAPGYYRSVLIMRADDPRAPFDGARLAYNEPSSQSGWAAPMTHAAGRGPRLLPHLQTGGHRLSAAAVAEGRADIAAIDAVTWRMIARHDAVADALRVVDRTDPTPGLPYIAATGAAREPLFAAISAAMDALSPGDRDTLCLRGIVHIPPESYLSVPNPPAPARFAQGV